jgi:sulfur-oxidizing protein SoxZ
MPPYLFPPIEIHTLSPSGRRGRSRSKLPPGPMSTIKIRVKRQEGVCLIRLLIAHPMDTGRQRDALSGNLIPAHFIQELKIEHNAKLVASCRLSTAVSRDPYLSFRLRGGAAGDRVKVSWTDNLGQSDSAETIIQ